MFQDKNFKDFYNHRASILGLEDGRDRYEFRIIKRYLKKNFMILDIGCGRGTFMNPLHEMGFNVVGLDNSINNVKLLKTKTENLILSNALERLPFKENVFDSIICAQFLEHFTIDAINSILKNIYRILKKAGYLFITVPYKENLNAGISICPNCKTIYHRYGHLVSFDETLLNELLYSNQFKLKKIFRIYGHFLYMLKVPLSLIKFLSHFDINLKKNIKGHSYGIYLAVAQKPPHN